MPAKTAKTKKPPATIDAIRRQLAEAEAVVGGLRAKLAKMEAHERGEAAPVCGLDLLWDAALPMSRQRSSKQLCRKAWAAIPSAARPTVHEAIAALKLWNRCDQWRASDNIYAPGLHRYIAARMWECPPQAPQPPQQRKAPQPPAAATSREPGVTDPEEIARLLGRAPKPATPAPAPAAAAAAQNNVHGPEQIAAMLSFISAAQS